MQGILLTARHVALVALLLRALIPAGWMPDAQMGITICSVGGTLGVIHHDGAPGHSDQQTAHDECPFAAAPHLASVPDVLHLALPALHEAAAQTASVRAAVIAARFVPQSPRAPPQTA